MRPIRALELIGGKSLESGDEHSPGRQPTWACLTSEPAHRSTR